MEKPRVMILGAGIEETNRAVKILEENGMEPVVVVNNEDSALTKTLKEPQNKTFDVDLNQFVERDIKSGKEKRRERRKKERKNQQP